MYRGGGGPFGVAAITGGVANLDAGSVTVPSLTLAGDSTVGWFRPSSGVWSFAAASANQMSIFNTGQRMYSGFTLQWNAHASDSTATQDTVIARSGIAIIGMYGASTANGASLRRYGGNAGYVEWGSVSELLTLSTSGTTTDTAANLLPANSYIECVTGRVTTTITTATDWKLGDATTAGRFTAADAVMTANELQVGLVHCDVTGAGGPRQTAAAKVRVTTTGTPGAGAIRITSYYRTFVAPTS